MLRLWRWARLENLQERRAKQTTQWSSHFCPALEDVLGVARGATPPHPSRPVYAPAVATPSELITVRRDVPAGSAYEGNHEKGDYLLDIRFSPNKKAPCRG